MTFVSSSLNAGGVLDRATELFTIDRQRNFRRVDRIFAGVMGLQWVFGIVLALLVSPFSYSGETRTLHLHVYMAIFLGAAISLLPILLAFFRPGRASTRHTIAIAQMLWSALLIHLSGGRIETHFHVFGSLALIAFYRDWKPLLGATVVVGVDHFIRGLLMPESVYGVAVVEPWRFLEHAGWVVFENVFLTLSCIHGTKEMRAIAMRQAEVEALSQRERAKSVELDAALSRVTNLNDELRRELAERQRAERELGRLTRERELILDNAADGVVGLDLNGVPTLLNPAASELIGWTLAELRSMEHSPHSLIHRRGPDGELCLADDCPLKLAYSSGEPLYSEEWLSHKHGRIFPAEVRVAPMLDRDGVHVGSVLTFQDISERREIERNKELESERLGGLGRLATSVAHEFNNVLMGAQPFAEMLLRADSTSPKGRVWSRQILDSIARGKRITEEILRFARPVEIDAKPVPIREWFDSIAHEVSGFISNRNLTLHIPDEPLYFDGDRLQMTQVLINLARNACDAMADGGSLTITADPVYSYQRFSFATLKTPDRFVHITVQDTGTGIPPDILPHIFEPLFTTKKSRGTGLGLAIAEQVVTRHAGHIFVESKMGSGTTFHIFLPAAIEGVDGEPIVAREYRAGRGRLLVVEDDPVVRAGISVILEEAGMDVTAVTSAREAFGSIEATIPDAVVLDIGLPDMDGADAYRQMVERWPRLPVIFSTGHADEARISDLLSQPQVRFLRKPYEAAALLGCVADLVA